MAKTALTQLQDQLEAIRREAFAAGYAAAMQSIREFAAKPSAALGSGAAAPRGRGRAAAAPPATPAQPRQRRARTTTTATPRAPRVRAQRPQRGTNARLVEEVLQSNAPRALRPAEIRSTIQRDRGVAIAFTSIRHALGQLETRRVAEQAADGKTWRYTGSAVSA